MHLPKDSKRYFIFTLIYIDLKTFDVSVKFKKELSDKTVEMI